jgi:hypothetical protein
VTTTPYAVVRGQVRELRAGDTLIVSPGDLDEVVVDGVTLARDGRATPEADAEHGTPAWTERWVGAWADEAQAMTQHLLPAGRYTETRSGRVDAWTGRFWTRGAVIAYLDDTGFWAFGELREGVLLHAHFVLVR